MTHICVDNLTIIGSDNGLLPGRRQAIIWTNDGLLLLGPLGTNFSEIVIEILTFSFKKMRLKVSSAKRRPFCLGLNVLRENFNFNTVMVCANICRDHFIAGWIRSKWNFYQIELQWKTLVIWAHDPNELNVWTSNGSWCIGIKGEMSGTVCVTFTWDIYIYMSCL